ncbi:putative plant lipid transfer protein/Par allergen [Helianthus annuus]|nr:putative plant non-specific lipid-transfer protein/Par allergen [Helianthus annuus]KAJ0443892.1 putative plant lipid transfer protein/Par allergen [Helianthus annuus]KAJ0461297.1 putative plant non-specific lipid-transfer protein/Par allergen [Helianthus annuus]KAJ0641730.1 putative plant non-specific lipid-transfer protein/Par allergen [Helianthus annuus]KAJ0645610.1 putative plant non-specific lipid-transfer protein/Par allergen [Helianthus annuus]
MAKTVMMVLCLAVACMVVADAITCGQVASSLAPCIGYLTKGGAVTPACCGAITGLNNAAKSTPDRQTTCGCLKGVLASNSGINLGNANSLPGKCGLNIPYKLSPSTDCSKYDTLMVELYAWRLLKILEAYDKK